MESMLRLQSSTSYAIPLHQKVEFQVAKPGASCPIYRWFFRAAIGATCHGSNRDNLWILEKAK